MAIERKMSCGKNTYQSSYTFELIDLEFSQSPKVSSFVFKRPTDLFIKNILWHRFLYNTY